MATADRPASDHLNLLRRATESARSYGFLALLRWAEAHAQGLPRIGRSRFPHQNVADLAHASTLDFPGPTIDSIEWTPTGRARVRSFFLGLTGPMGALPLHLTEFAHYERKYSKSQPFGRFLDLLTDRMLQFFFRAWADSQPAAQADRIEDDRFALYLAAITGTPEHFHARALPLRARLHYAGLLITRKSPAVIQDFLTHLLRAPVTVREFVPRWRLIEQTDRTRIGRRGAFHRLGRGSVLGSQTLAIDDTVEVTIRTQNMSDYERRLPSGSEFAIAAEALDTIVPEHLEWRFILEVDEREAQAATIGSASRLGWSAWLAPQGRPLQRGDIHLGRRHVEFRQKTQERARA
jgi:type VI secretion system ImpH/TssG family protein